MYEMDFFFNVTNPMAYQQFPGIMFHVIWQMQLTYTKHKEITLIITSILRFLGLPAMTI
jgi:hypothetical protein